MKRSYSLLIGVAALCVALDQWTKHWASAHLAYAEPIRVVGDYVRLTYTRNSGIAFGFFAGHSFPFYVFSIIAAVAVLALFMRARVLTPARHWSLALILGGAIGNLIDRVATGEVVDFILLAWGRSEFPVFNVADVCVTTGVALFALVWTRDAHEPAAPAASTTLSSLSELRTHDAHAGTDRPAGTGSAASGPLAGEGTDRPLS